MTIIDGTTIAGEILKNIRAQTDALTVPIQLAAICAGDDPGLRAFVRIKQRVAHSAGIQFSSYMFGADQQGDAEEAMKFLAHDDSVQGIFVELPVPDGWNRTKLLPLIPLEKDVDLISPAGEKAFASGTSHILPPAVKALEYVIQTYDIPLHHMQAVVVGQGALVGIPIAHWLRNNGAQVQIIDVHTPKPELLCREADLVIVGVGAPGLVTGNWIKKNATVIDFGYNQRNGVSVGDVDSESVTKKAGLYTPVPGGMGPLVVAAVLENLLALATR